MVFLPENQTTISGQVEPKCPVFGLCGGCLYQNIEYDEELILKESRLREVLNSALDLPEDVFEKIVASPEQYSYRHRLDVGLYRRSGELVMGFMKERSRKIIPIESCAIARKEVSDFLPLIKKIAGEKLPPKYRTANLVIRTGDDGRVFWGGIGRHSLRMQPEDYLWTEAAGKRIYYSMETFFQANLSILPFVIDKIRSWKTVDRATSFYDLYGGVGLFGMSLSDDAGEVVIVEENPGSVELAKFNAAYHGIENKVRVIEGKVEGEWTKISEESKFAKKAAMIDPPRKGLSESLLRMFRDEKLSGVNALDSLMYLSCSPESLARDLKVLTGCGWKVSKVVPFDFFPKTQHIETLVLLRP